MTGRRARAVRSRKPVSGRNTVARTTQRRHEAVTPEQRRFGRGSKGQTQSPRRFARSARPTEPERRFGRASARPSAGGIRAMLPGGRGKSSANRPGGSIPVVGGLLSSRGGTKKLGAGGGRRPAMLGLLGAGAAGAAAVVAKRRHGSRSSAAAGEARDVPEAQLTSTAATTPAHPADSPSPDET